MPTPLVDWLRAQDDDTLADLLRLRPDLAVPPPADLTVLATRAGIRASVHRACDDLDTVALHVAGGARRRGRGHRAGAAGRARAGCSGRTCPLPSSTRRWPRCGRARSRGTRSTPTRPDERPGSRSSRRPATSCPASRAASAGPRRGSPRRPRCRSCSPRVDPDERRVLEALAAGPPVGRSRAVRTRRARSAGCWPAGCCCGSTPRPSSCPARSGSRCAATGRWARWPSARRTSGPWTAASGTVDRTAAGAALRALRQVELLVAFWATTPAAGAAFGRPRCAGAAAGGSRGRRRRDRRPRCSSRSPWRPTWSGRATASRPSGCRRPRPTSGRPGARSRSGPRWPAPGSTCRACRGSSAPGTTPGGRSPRCPTARAARRPPATGAGCSPGSPSCRRERPWVTSDALAGLLAWRAPRRGGRLRDEVVRLGAGRGDGAGRRRARRALDAGADAARPSRRAPPPRCAPRCPSRSTTSCCRPT